jgi:hypothetical protein
MLLSRDFRRCSIFDFCNKICHQQTSSGTYPLWITGPLSERADGREFKIKG